MRHLECNYCQKLFESEYHFKRHELSHKHRVNEELFLHKQKNILSYSNEELKKFLLKQFSSWKHYFIFNNGNWIERVGAGPYPFLSSPAVIYALIQYKEQKPSICGKDIKKKLLENGVCNEINVPAVCTICNNLRKLGYEKNSSEPWKNSLMMEYYTPLPNLSSIYNELKDCSTPIENEEYFVVEEKKPLVIDEVDPLVIDEVDVMCIEDDDDIMCIDN